MLKQNERSPAVDRFECMAEHQRELGSFLFCDMGDQSLQMLKKNPGYYLVTQAGEKRKERAKRAMTEDRVDPYMMCSKDDMYGRESAVLL